MKGGRLGSHAVDPAELRPFRSVFKAYKPVWQVWEFDGQAAALVKECETEEEADQYLPHPRKKAK